jgi:MFS family permease
LKPTSAKQSNLLILIVFAQFAGTSLWFAGNAVIDKINPGIHQAMITSFVQFGFIAGTLLYSLLTIADRFFPPAVFFYSTLIASFSNLLIIWLGSDEVVLFLLRFLTGFFLAGIYPVGMKICADLYPERLGKALGFLVGALVVGTAFPHLVRSQLQSINWEVVIISTSIVAAFGGLLLYLLLPRYAVSGSCQKPDLTIGLKQFRSTNFRSAAFGYFGHMWELYAFWALLPMMIGYYNEKHNIAHNIFLWSFLVIAVGCAGCVAGGLASQKYGSKIVAVISLAFSGLCCLLAPFLFQVPAVLFFLFLLAWGMTVVADSPQFSSLVAQNANSKNKGTALTMVTSIGFAITIVSILLLKSFFVQFKEFGLWLLVPGPLLGLLSLKRKA